MRTTRETRYVYNNADQLRMVEDGQGGRRYRFYDEAGRLEYAVDATGAVTRSEYNATGQLVGRPDRTASISAKLYGAPTNGHEAESPAARSSETARRMRS